ncbi:hypothetical protein L596_008093 [Steinernema carpocapsae]|uniref:Uncharacterized protein n=1 Tax=Steinernema carpocapsae TaxID=34508 RepID=A0A4U5PBX3_STECR|nr:hypothetical protein L596_008093 [Steinernema carpocapsae]
MGHDSPNRPALIRSRRSREAARLTSEAGFCKSETGNPPQRGFVFANLSERISSRPHLYSRIIIIPNSNRAERVYSPALNRDDHASLRPLDAFSMSSLPLFEALGRPFTTPAAACVHAELLLALIRIVSPCKSLF